MATYPLIFRPSFSYEDHLMHNQYVADINKGLARASSEIIKGQALSTLAVAETMNRNADFLAKTITGGAEMVSLDIQNLTQAVEYGLDQVTDGIAGLRADFDIAMGQVISQFEMMRSEMRDGFDRMINILENRRKTEAQEHFRDAMEFYRDGCRFADKPQWFDDALKHFLVSVEQYERNPLSHMHIGHIYHYQKKHQNFEKALHHYHLCYTYGEADEKDYSVAAQGYFYAGWLCAAVFNNLEEAITSMEKALRLDSKLGEACYLLAKFHGVREDAKLVVKYLERAIVDFDRDYCIKASGDADFDKVRDAVNDLLVRLKEKAKDHLEKVLLPLNRDFDPKDSNWRKALETGWKEIDALRNKGAYFNYLDGLKPAEHLTRLFSQASSAREKHYDRAVQAVEKLDEFIQSHVCLDKHVEQKDRARLEEVKALLAKDAHTAHDEAMQITDSLLRKSSTYTFVESINIKDEEHYNSNCVAFSPDGRFIASGGYDGIYLWDAETGEQVSGFESQGYSESIDHIAFSMDGSLIVSAYSYGKITLWDARTGKPLKKFKVGKKDFLGETHCVTFSPDDLFILSCHDNTWNPLRLWNAHKGDLVREFDGKSPDPDSWSRDDSIGSVAFSPDGRFIISGSNKGKVRLWDARTGELVSTSECGGGESRETSVAFSPDGKLAISGSYAGLIRFFDARTGKLIPKFDRQSPDDVLCLAFSPDGKFLITGGGKQDKGVLRLWEAQSGDPVESFEGQAHTKWILSVAFTPDSRFIVSGSMDDTIRLWARNWVTHEELEWRQAEKQRREDKQRKITVENRKREGLCLACGEPIGFFQKVRKSLYCDKHK